MAKVNIFRCLLFLPMRLFSSAWRRERRFHQLLHVGVDCNLPNEKQSGRLIIFAFPLHFITRRLQETRSSIRVDNFQLGTVWITWLPYSFPPSLDFHLISVKNAKNGCKEPIEEKRLLTALLFFLWKGKEKRLEEYERDCNKKRRGNTLISSASIYSAHH